MGKHTPGPWTFHRDTVYGTDNLEICSMGYTPQCESGWEDYPNFEANACAIAALPDLLSAAKKMAAFYKDLSTSNPGFLAKLTLQDYQQWNEAMIELPAAIAKAEKGGKS